MPGGRPSTIDKAVAEIDGQPIAAADHIVALVAAGNYVETAAAAAGISKETLYEWLRVGAQAHQKDGRLTKHEARCREFSDAVATALARSEAEAVARLDLMARGGAKARTITTRTVGDKVVEITEKIEVLAPSVAAETWRLERRFGKRWGRKQEITGAEGGPITLDLAASARSVIEDKLDEIAERIVPTTPAPAVTPPEG